MSSRSVPGRAGVPGAPAVVAEHLAKEFSLRHARSLKETVVWLAKGRRQDISNRFRALEDLSVRIDPGESVALVGLNGSGKSTFLKLISGVMSPDGGTLEVNGRVAGLIEVGAGFHPDLTGRDNVYLNGAILGMTRAQIDERFDEIVAFSEIEQFIDTEVKFYSSGMYLRLAFAVAVFTDPDIFLIDEILSVGDEPFQRKSLGRVRELSEEGKTLLVVSHDFDVVRKVCERAVWIEHGRVRSDGPIDRVIEEFRAAENA
ncbi:MULTISPECIES: ABC transporter ATP-binding protein [Kocuria]|uniref:ABC transporter ATP-binding protein n=1 Tax=Kocuria oceani TaxID=988827 RepID=A0ABV9TP34_9MICC|nr:MULTISPECIES: ABC transporter ATP-binding protein [Kocuria]